MQIGHDENLLALFLKEQGIYVLTVDGVDWYEYSGFMVPAYLPHCCPSVTAEIAEEVVRLSGKPFARWHSQFGLSKENQWWYVLKRGQWNIDQIKDKKKRWMIRQGKKNFTVRPLDFEEVVAKCPQVAEAATSRYMGKYEVETAKMLERRVAAAVKVPGVLEHLGCFCGDKLVSFSENYIQNNAVWLANMRHDPAFLERYSSYGFVDGILDYYLNRKKMDYVLDGCRSIHHRTQFQEHLIKVFEFTKEYAILNVVYSAKFKSLVNIAYPFRKLVNSLYGRIQNNTLDSVNAVLKQEYIRRECEKL